MNKHTKTAVKQGHTKGPWKCVKYPKVFSIVSGSKRQIAIMTEHHGDCPEMPIHQFERSEQDAADAALIAAAPELLFAAKIAEGWFSASGKITKEGMESIRLLLKDAIAKAEGGAE